MNLQIQKVTGMEEQNNLPQEEQTEEKQGYVPRPAWQVWGARILLAIFLIFLAMYYLRIARG